MRMMLCHGCTRHVRLGAGACPFCGVALAHASAPVITTVLLGLALAGCTDRSTGEESTTQTTMTTADESTSSTGEGSSSTDPFMTNSQEAVTYAAPSIEIDLEALHGTGGTTGDDDTTGE